MTKSRTLVLGWLSLSSLACVLVVNAASAKLVPQAPIPLVTAGADLYGWSGVRIAPDGTKVLFTAQENEPFSHTRTNLYEVSIGGGPLISRSKESFPAGVTHFSFLPNGTELLIKEHVDCLACYSGDVFVMPVSAGLVKQLTFDDGVGGGLGWLPEFSPDGSRLVFQGVGSNRDQGLFSVPLDGSAPAIRLNEPMSHWFSLGTDDWKFLPGGSDVLYSAPLAGESAYNLFKVNVAGGPSQRLNLTEGLHVWRAQTNAFATNVAGSRVAYSVHQGPLGQPTVMSRQIAGGAEAELAPGLAKHEDIQIEIHGFAQDQVVFDGDFNQPYRYELFAAPADGGPARNVSAGHSYVPNSAVISPSGNAVFFNSYSNNIWPYYPDTGRELFRYDVSTGLVRSLGVFPASTVEPRVEFDVSGNYFVTLGAVVAPKLFMADGEFVRSLDNGFQRFHPDGQHFLYPEFQAGSTNNRIELFMERLDGVGDPILISGDMLGRSSVQEFSFSSDGMMLVYSRIEFGQPLEIYKVSFVPEPRIKVFVVAAAIFSSGARRTSSLRKVQQRACRATRHADSK